ncbi:MAG: hypothetical protein LAT81_07800 [Oceanicaulis sp.]|nr:hypothetical protein [Oceanicaulis sp.]
MAAKRDSTYCRGRLQREAPAIFADLNAGRIGSVRQAAAMAGIKPLPKTLNNLKREWRKASAAERREFIDWIRGSLPTAKAPAKSAPVAAYRAVFDVDGHLTADAIAFLKAWQKREGKRPGRILQQLGFRRNDFRLAAAINRRVRLANELTGPVDGWMRRNGF